MIRLIFIYLVTAQLDNLSNLKNEFNSFLKKYESNSCIMKIINKFQHQCHDLNDKVNSVISYQMTLCIYKTLNRKIEECTEGDDCITKISKLTGDAWTTFISFSHHIDNICFYYKTLIWEKSSEFLFSKLLNSSLSILKELTNSANIAERILNFQEDFSNQLNTNIAETIQSFKNINQFLENYSKIEEELKNNIITLENKINSNNEKVNDFLDYLNNKLEMIIKLRGFLYNEYPNGSNINYFLFLFTIVWILSFSSSLNQLRIYLYLTVIIFFLFERFLLCSLLNIYYSEGYFSQLYYVVFFYIFRVFYLLSILLYSFVKSRNIKNTEIVIPESYLNITPVWMRKYFTRIKKQNDYLIEKFQLLNKLIEQEEYNEFFN
jgi:hypothetical protein